MEDSFLSAGLLQGQHDRLPRLVQRALHQGAQHRRKDAPTSSRTREMIGDILNIHMSAFAMFNGLYISNVCKSKHKHFGGADTVRTIVSLPKM